MQKSQKKIEIPGKKHKKGSRDENKEDEMKNQSGVANREG